MNITAATGGGTIRFRASLRTADEDSSTRATAAYMGYVHGFRRNCHPIPRRVADLDMVRLVSDAGASEAGAVVDHLIRRFLRVEPSAADRAVLVDFLRGELGSGRVESDTPRTEAALRALLYLILSMPEYQLA